LNAGGKSNASIAIIILNQQTAENGHPKQSENVHHMTLVLDFILQSCTHHPGPAQKIAAGRLIIDN